MEADEHEPAPGAESRPDRDLENQQPEEGEEDEPEREPLLPLETSKSEKSQSAISPSPSASTNTNTSSSGAKCALALALLLVGVQFCSTQYVSRFYMDAIKNDPDAAARRADPALNDVAVHSPSGRSGQAAPQMSSPSTASALNRSASVTAAVKLRPGRGCGTTIDTCSYLVEVHVHVERIEPEVPRTPVLSLIHI